MARRQGRSSIERELETGRRRLALGYAIGMAVALCAVLIGGYFMHSALVKQSLSTELAQLSQREAEVHKPDLEDWVAGHTNPADVSIGYRPHRTAFYYIMSSDSELVHGNETQPELRDAVLDHIRTEVLPRGEVVFREIEPDGAEKPVRLAVLRRPIDDDEGRYIGSVYAATDVGGALAHLEQLLSIMLALAFGVVGLAGFGGWWMADRSLLPLRRALAQQRAFIANASHELRAPLTVMQAALSIVERDAGERLDPFHRQSISDARAETQRLGDLAAQMLLLARADAGALEMRPAALDLVDLVERQIRLHRFRADAQEQALHAELPEQAMIEGDGDLLARALSAALDNALSYTPSGGRIFVRLTRERGDWRLEIANSGPGMSPDTVAQAFTRFYRADESRARHRGGAGLGLPIIREVFDLHGGQATIESGANEDTRLILTFPG